MAIRPEGGQATEIFVADRGAGRIFECASRPDSAEDMVTGFPTSQSSSDKSSVVGMQSLYFLDHMRLAAAGMVTTRSRSCVCTNCKKAQARCNSTIRSKVLNYPTATEPGKNDGRSFL